MELKLELKDRLILANQYKLLSYIDKDNQIEHEASLAIVEHGYDSMFSNLLVNHFDSPLENNKTVKYVLEILDLYNNIDYLVKQFNEEDSPFLAFNGFVSGSFEYHVMNLIVHKFNSYTKFKNFIQNSNDGNDIVRYDIINQNYKSIKQSKNEITIEDMRLILEKVRDQLT